MQTHWLEQQCQLQQELSDLQMNMQSSFIHPNLVLARAPTRPANQNWNLNVR